MLELIVIILVILWVVGGIALPATGGLLNILLAVAIGVLIIKLIRSAK